MRKAVRKSFISALLGSLALANEGNCFKALLLKCLIALDAIHRCKGTVATLAFLGQQLFIAELLCFWDMKPHACKQQYGKLTPCWFGSIVTRIQTTNGQPM